MAFASDYLVGPVPDSLPSWGGSSGRDVIRIDFSGGPYRIIGLKPVHRETICDRFAGLCWKGEAKQASGVDMGVHGLPRHFFRPVDLTGREYTFDRAYSERDIRMAGKNFLGFIEWQPVLRGAFYLSDAPGRDFLMAFENFFRVLTAYRALQSDGAILHSACVATGGGAYLLFGHSGAGKSTFSRLALEAGWEVLSDDLNLVRRDGEGWVAERIPFAGDLNQTPTRGSLYPLRGFFALKKGNANLFSRITPAQAVARSFACAPMVNEDPYRSDVLMERLHEVVSTVPTGMIEFRRDREALDLLTNGA